MKHNRLHLVWWSEDFSRVPNNFWINFSWYPFGLPLKLTIFFVKVIATINKVEWTETSKTVRLIFYNSLALLLSQLIF